MPCIGSSPANTKAGIGEERALAWSLEFTLIRLSIKLAAESFFLWNMVLEVYIFKRGGRKWLHYAKMYRNVRLETRYRKKYKEWQWGW